MKDASFVLTVGTVKNKLDEITQEVFRNFSKYLLFFIARNVTFYLEDFLNTNEQV